MLQQILDDMFIDPELLGELSEEQKQILFCKMREEQVRKWETIETDLIKQEAASGLRQRTPSRKGFHVDFHKGADGKPWVWVMGEHADDMTIEERLNTEAKEKARLLAEKEAEEIKKRQEHERKQLVENLHSLKEKREQELLNAQREYEERLQRQAEEAMKSQDALWREQEKRAKEAETHRRNIARHAREEYRRNSLRKSSSPTSPTRSPSAKMENNNQFPAHITANGTSVSPLPLVERPIKPPNRQAVVDWFKLEERPKGVGINSVTKIVEPWFHGIISRSQAESLLKDKSVGSFLVRVSERVWGYAVSYKAAERCKHFLIDSTDGFYQFFGTEQILHGSLADLIEYHISRPISLAGQEFLRDACGQAAEGSHDYQELFLDETTEITFV